MLVVKRKRWWIFIIAKTEEQSEKKVGIPYLINISDFDGETCIKRSLEMIDRYE